MEIPESRGTMGGVEFTITAVADRDAWEVHAVAPPTTEDRLFLRLGGVQP